jgi:hypothetical protein
LRFLYQRQDINEITESAAQKLCADKISGSLAVQEYSDVSGNEDPDEVIKQCIFDVVVRKLFHSDVSYFRRWNKMFNRRH